MRRREKDDAGEKLVVHLTERIAKSKETKNARKCRREERLANFWQEKRKEFDGTTKAMDQKRKDRGPKTPTQ